MNPRSALVLASACGLGVPALADAPADLSIGRFAPTRHVGHMYYNVATGERVVTLLDDARPADSAPSEVVWIADNSLPCAAYGQTDGIFVVMESPDCTTCFTSEDQSGLTFMDWGDIAHDSVIDCVSISWTSAVPDTDVDSDGVGDGVEGFGATWSFWDAEDGFNSSDTHLHILSITLTSLPGTLDEDIASTYTATLDLAQSFSSSVVFEIGDTDSIDDSGTGHYNPGAGADLDSDGRADFGYSLRYYQPGTTDFDGDGSPDGDDELADIVGWRTAVPDGEVAHGGGGNAWSFIPDAPPAGQGVEDVYDKYIDFDSDWVLEFIGSYYFGGFSCDANGDGVTGDTRPYAQFEAKLYGPGCVNCPVCPWDIAEPIGILNFFDVSAFIAMYPSPKVDIAPPFGEVNFFDLVAFINGFTDGCP